MLGELCNNAAIPASPFRIVIKKKPALMWFDAEANFERFSHKDSIDYYLEKIKSVGFTHAIVDIRPITGEVLYQSQFAPQMKEVERRKRPGILIICNTSLKKGTNWVLRFMLH